MSSSINHALVSALVETAGCALARQRWMPGLDIPLHLLGLANGLNAMPELGADVALDEIGNAIGLGVLGSSLLAKAERGIWPTSGMRRIAAIAMEEGARASHLLGVMPHLANYVASMLDACAMHAPGCVEVELWRLSLLTFIGEPGSSEAIKAWLSRYPIREDWQDLLSKAGKEMRTCQSTRDFADLACRLFPEDQHHQVDEGCPFDSPSLPGEGDGTSHDHVSSDPKGCERGQPQSAEAAAGLADASDSMPPPEACDVASGEFELEPAHLDPSQEASIEGGTPSLSDDHLGAGVESPGFYWLGSAACLDPREGADGRASRPQGTARLTAVLLRALLAQAPRERVTDRPCGRVDPSRYWRVDLGDMSVFRHANRSQGIDTAVALLADTSGSMGQGGKIDVLRSCVATVLTAMTPVRGLAHACFAFPGRTGADSIKPFDGRLRLSDVAQLRAGGGTPTAAALDKVLPAMRLRREARRIVIIITDGDSMKDGLQCSIDRYQSLGIRIVAIAIEGDRRRRNNIRDFVPTRSIDEIHGLSSALQACLLDAVTLQAA